MRKLSETKITVSVFYFILTVWTIVMIVESVVSIFAANQFIVEWMIFPEYILYNLFTIGAALIILLSVFFPLTLVLFYLRMMSVKVSFVWLRRIFITNAALFFILNVVSIILENWGILTQFLIFIIPHCIILLKLEPFFNRFEQKGVKGRSN